MVGTCIAKRHLSYDGTPLSGMDSVVGRRPLYYDPTPGRFNTLDPFEGNLESPQSLHKYLYTPDDPVNFSDPTGREFSLTGMLSSIRIGLGLIGQFAGAVLHVGARIAQLAMPVVRIGTGVWVGFSVFNTWYEFRNRLNKSSSFGQGGYNADTILLKVRNAVINQWNGLPTAKKEEVIDYMHGFNSGQTAWDVTELTYQDKPRWTEGLVGDVAEETLTYKGRVYPVAEVNYLLWGLVNGLAYKDGIRTQQTSIENTTWQVAKYRGFAGGGIVADQWWKGEVPRFETMSGKVAWAGYGWGWAWTDDPPAPTEEALTYAIPNGVPWPHVMMFHAGPPNAHLIDGIVQ